MAQPFRAFIAVQLSDPVRRDAQRLIELLRPAPATVRWVAPESLHITIMFLGDVLPRQLDAVCRSLDAAVRPLKPFQIEVKGAGAFPSAERPHTVWLGIAAGSEPMTKLHAVVQAEMGRQGFRVERRRYHPHLTLGRVRGEAPGVEELGELLVQYPDYAAGRCTVEGVTLYSSELHPSGPVYSELYRAGLRG